MVRVLGVVLGVGCFQQAPFKLLTLQPPRRSREKVWDLLCFAALLPCRSCSQPRRPNLRAVSAESQPLDSLRLKGSTARRSGLTACRQHSLLRSTSAQHAKDYDPHVGRKSRSDYDYHDQRSTQGSWRNVCGVQAVLTLSGVGRTQGSSRGVRSPAQLCRTSPESQGLINSKTSD